MNEGKKHDFSFLIHIKVCIITEKSGVSSEYMDGLYLNESSIQRELEVFLCWTVNLPVVRDFKGCWCTLEVLMKNRHVHELAEE